MAMPEHIVIVGGGTAGWMSANILAFSLSQYPVRITVLESSDIKTIGVGEGSTPALKVFFDRLGIPESEWMRRCSATYKCGITFAGWSTVPGFEQYFHPFASALDDGPFQRYARQFAGDSGAWGAALHPDHYFLASYLARDRLAPVPHHNFPFETFYGYHFDAEKVGAFLREKALQRGVRHEVATVLEVQLGEQGNVAGLVCDDGKTRGADFFIDCSGFRGLLSQAALQVPFVSYADTLFNDAAVALPSMVERRLPSQTVSTALQHGWAWQIPLSGRFGNGYVYSSRYCSADSAETELRKHLGLLDADVPARHLKMKVGRVTRSWHRNVLAVGLSQGFIEPLEATALLLVQQTVSLFAHAFIQGRFTDQLCDTFNDAINEQFDRTRDYIHTHYKLNSRDDTPYWRDNRANTAGMNDSLAAIFDVWQRGGDLAAEIQRQRIECFYPVPSWYCILAGMGVARSADGAGAVRKGAGPAEAPAETRDFLQRCARNFDDHRSYLEAQGLSAPEVSRVAH